MPMIDKDKSKGVKRIVVSTLGKGAYFGTQELRLDLAYKKIKKLKPKREQMARCLTTKVKLYKLHFHVSWTKFLHLYRDS